MQYAVDSIRTEILDAVTNDDLLLPTMPEVALRLREVANDPEVDAHAIAGVIGSDAALSARIIKVANSPLIRGLQTVEDLQMAVSRMGIAYATNLAIAIGMEQLFTATSEAVDTRMRETWEHSTLVASLSYVLCKHFTKLRPDQAMLAGLTHGIGKLPILVWADYNDWEDSMIDSVSEKLHPQLGGMILRAWDFPDELLDVPVEYSEFERQVDDVDYIDVVMVANLQVHTGTKHPLAKVDCSQINAFENLGIAVDIVLAESEDMGKEIAAANDIYLVS